MRTSSKGMLLIINLVSYNLTAFKEQLSDQYWTIGYGHTGSDVHEGDTITEKRAEELFKQDIIPYEDAVNDLQKTLPFTLNQDQFNALVSFSFDMGIDYLKDFEGNDEQVIAGKILKYCHDSKGDVVPKLKGRRDKEYALFVQGTNGINLNIEDEESLRKILKTLGILLNH